LTLSVGFDQSHPVEAGDWSLNKAIAFVEVDALTAVDLKDALNQCGELAREFLRKKAAVIPLRARTQMTRRS
jgi:hypothetical protein